MHKKKQIRRLVTRLYVILVCVTSLEFRNVPTKKNAASLAKTPDIFRILLSELSVWLVLVWSNSRG